MFVSVTCDVGSDDNRNAVYELLKLYGFKEIMTNVYESTRIQDNSLLRLKRDIDKATDFYDKIRFYQYPMENTLAITYLTEKKWRKYVIKS